jgi:hypothetical protein
MKTAINPHRVAALASLLLIVASSFAHAKKRDCIEFNIGEWSGKVCRAR